MRKPSLTEHPVYRDGVMLHAYPYGGGRVLVADSARNMLLLIELFADGDIDPRGKAALVCEMLWPFDDLKQAAMDAANGDMAALLDSVVWDACGLDISGTRDAPKEQVFDWDEDAARIQASVMQAFGMGWAEFADGHTYAEACALLGELMEGGEETPFRSAVYYRTAEPPKRTKGNDAQVRAFYAKKRHYALKGGQTWQERAAATFERMREVARKNG